MNLNNNKQPLTKEPHTYVALNQRNSPELRVDGSNDEDEVEDDDKKIDENSNGSDTSVGNILPEYGVSTNSKYSDLTKKLLSAIAYGVCSFLITVINKIVLTSYEFPSATILGVGQMLAILIILKVANFFHVVTIRQTSLKNKKIWTLAILYLCNLITGLAGTKHLPLPMFVALRRFSIAMTAIGEFYILHVKQTVSVILTIVAMIGGALIAAVADLTFNTVGYLLVLSGDFFTAANGVYMKKTINSQEINKHEILFYNALLTIIPAILIASFTTTKEELLNYNHWNEIGFIFSFLTSCAMGYLLMFSTLLCTHYNSALTTTIIGTLKNILTTYIGMFIGGDYRYSNLNFLGLNISLLGSLVYTYLTFHRGAKKEPTNTVQAK